MRKPVLKILATIIFAVTMSITAFAGQWQQDTTGWWYQNDNGSYCNNGWRWIDGKCYYFTPEGYCLINTTTPDNYQVDSTGAWIVNGAVQIQTDVADGKVELCISENCDSKYIGSCYKM